MGKKRRRRRSPVSRNPTCPVCHGDLVPGCNHDCPLAPKKPKVQQWVMWLVAFVFQFFILIGTFVWQAGKLSAEMESMQENQKRIEEKLKDIDNYFLYGRKPGVTP